MSIELGQYWEFQLHGLVKDLISFLTVRERISQFGSTKPEVEKEIQPETDDNFELEGLPECSGSKPTKPIELEEPDAEAKELSILVEAIIPSYQRLQSIRTKTPFSRDRVFPLIPAIVYHHAIELSETILPHQEVPRSYLEVLTCLKPIITAGDDAAPSERTIITFNKIEEPILPNICARDIGEYETKNGNLYRTDSARPILIQLLGEWVAFSYGNFDRAYEHIQSALRDSGARLLPLIAEAERTEELQRIAALRKMSPEANVRPRPRFKSQFLRTSASLLEQLSWNDTRENHYTRIRRAETTYTNLLQPHRIS